MKNKVNYLQTINNVNLLLTRWETWNSKIGQVLEKWDYEYIQSILTTLELTLNL